MDDVMMKSPTPQKHILNQDFKNRFIIGLQGGSLDINERALLKELSPAGYILFTRNCQNQAQLQSLIDELYTLHTEINAPTPIISIDQEGGVVQRLASFYKDPWTQHDIWQAFQTMNEHAFDRYLDQHIAARCALLRSIGVTMNYVPLADLVFDHTHSIIKGRAFLTDDPFIVSRLCNKIMDLYSHYDMLTVLKHCPGHGRAHTDTHKEAAIVDASIDSLDQSDFLAFKLSAAHSPAMMIAHVIYKQIDEHLPASISPKIIQDIIKHTDHIGYQGPLMSDDIDMQALSVFGDIKKRYELCLRAGCDFVIWGNPTLDGIEAFLRP